jgi:hypothetical protein
MGHTILPVPDNGKNLSDVISGADRITLSVLNPYDSKYWRMQERLRFWCSCKGGIRQAVHDGLKEKACRKQVAVNLAGFGTLTILVEGRSDICRDEEATMKVLIPEWVDIGATQQFLCRMRSKINAHEEITLMDT